MGNGNVNATPKGPYLDGQSIRLTATPDPGWAFADWSGGLSGSTNPETLVISSNTTVTATFVPLPPAEEYTMTMDIVGEGVVDIEPPGPYTAGQMVMLTAMPAEEWAFAQWDGDLSGDYNPALLSVAGSTAITATFEPFSDVQEFSLVTKSVGGG